MGGQERKRSDELLGLSGVAAGSTTAPALSHTRQCDDYRFDYHVATGDDADCICGQPVPWTPTMPARLAGNPAC